MVTWMRLTLRMIWGGVTGGGSMLSGRYVIDHYMHPTILYTLLHYIHPTILYTLHYSIYPTILYTLCHYIHFTISYKLPYFIHIMLHAMYADTVYMPYTAHYAVDTPVSLG